ALRRLPRHRRRPPAARRCRALSPPPRHRRPRRYGIGKDRMANDDAWTSLRLNPRQEELVERLRRDRMLSVSALAEALQVSTETIRRDVRGLAAKGVVVKQHGNVLWPENRDDEPLQRRMAANMGAKKRIAQAIAKEIKDGESLLIDSG